MSVGAARSGRADSNVTCAIDDLKARASMHEDILRVTGDAAEKTTAASQAVASRLEGSMRTLATATTSQTRDWLAHLSTASAAAESLEAAAAEADAREKTATEKKRELDEAHNVSLAVEIRLTDIAGRSWRTFKDADLLPPQPVPKPAKRVNACLRCTFENQLSASVCEMCDSQLVGHV